MKRLLILSASIGISLGLCQIASSTTTASPVHSANFINTINGIVWDPSHRPVADVYVELQNEMQMSLTRTRTTSSGRFSFTVANSGNYYVKVLAGGTPYMDASE